MNVEKLDFVVLLGYNSTNITLDIQEDKQMTGVDLKAYTARAAELEIAIYTQKKLMDEYKDKISRARPRPPHKPNIKIPVRPVKPTEQTSKGGCNWGLWLALGIPIAIGCIAFISALPVFGLIVTGLCVFGAASMLSSQGNDNEKAKQTMRQYEKDMVKYNSDMESYRRGCQYAQQNYEYAMQEYNGLVKEYDTKCSSIIQQHDNTLQALEEALAAHYNSGLIFPKYRNMVAITTISEYLVSGRCYELEGPNGAYNLYEMELRQNIVINQLSSIITNLEQIRNNQYTLYQELVKANDTVEQVLSTVRGVEENTRLTAYFAEVNAIIAAAPRVTIGHTF